MEGEDLSDDSDDVIDQQFMHHSASEDGMYTCIVRLCVRPYVHACVCTQSSKMMTLLIAHVSEATPSHSPCRCVCLQHYIICTCVAPAIHHGCMCVDEDRCPCAEATGGSAAIHAEVTVS